MSTQTHHVEAGSPDGRPVVFIHGFPFSQAMWRPQLEALSGKGLRLIAYDVRGHGRTPAGDGLYSVDLFVDDLMELLDRLKIGRAALVGLSMGGYVALRAADREPGRVGALVLADTRAEPDANQAKALRAGAMRLIAEKGMGPFAEEFVKNLFSPATLAARRPCVDEIKAIMKANPPLGARGTLLALAARMDATQWLGKIGVPALVLVGEDDAVTPPANSEALAKGIPGARLSVIPRAGHLSSLENPEAFNEALADFLQENP